MVIEAIKCLLELVLSEYQISHEEEALIEFKKLLNQLKILVQEQDMFGTLINVQILEAKLEAIEGKYDNTVLKLEKALEIATRNKMEEYIKIVHGEQKNIERQFIKMQQILEENQYTMYLLYNSDILNYLTEALKLI